jgi:hypothetical protein
VADLPTTVEELDQLAKAGSMMLVGAMATEAFDVARAGIARLFRRFKSGKQRAVAERLGEDGELVDETADAERPGVRAQLAPSWELRLRRLLEEHADAEADLRELVAQIESAIPEPQQRWVQTNIARDHAAVYAAQGGNVIHHEVHGGNREITGTPPAPDDADAPG